MNKPLTLEIWIDGGWMITGSYRDRADAERWQEFWKAQGYRTRLTGGPRKPKAEQSLAQELANNTCRAVDALHQLDVESLAERSRRIERDAQDWNTESEQFGGAKLAHAVTAPDERWTAEQSRTSQTVQAEAEQSPAWEVSQDSIHWHPAASLSSGPDDSLAPDIWRTATLTDGSTLAVKFWRQKAEQSPTKLLDDTGDTISPALGVTAGTGEYVMPGEEPEREAEVRK